MHNNTSFAVNPGFSRTTTGVDQAPMRILVLDRSPETLEKIARTLWVWPNQLTSVKSLDEAIRSARIFSPTIVLASIEFFRQDAANSIRVLRDSLPDAPFIALGASSNPAEMAALLGKGADAFLSYEDLVRYNLHNILTRVQRIPRTAVVKKTLAMIRLPIPWHNSRIVGAFICDVDSTIIAANECLADWLEFPGARSLVGKSVRRDLMQNPDDWNAWTDIAGDVTASLQQTIGIKSNNQRLLHMRAEVFSAPDSPTRLQAMLAL